MTQKPDNPQALADKVALVKELDAKRTQGEWRSRADVGSRASIIPLGSSYEIARVKVLLHNGDNAMADAAFIAHAPQMAALITQLWDENQKQSEVLAQAKIDLEAIEILARVGNNTMIIEKTAKSAIDNVMKVGG